MSVHESAILDQADRSKTLLRTRGGLRRSFKGKAFLIPSFITVVGLFCGFLAIINSFRGNFDHAVICVILAAVFDGLDGRVARRLNATSAFGLEFDSLCDLVAFGVAPALAVYCWCFAHTADELGVLASFLFVACSATRLARFNITSSTPTQPTESKRHFQGMPTPAAAISAMAMIFFHPAPVTSSTGTIVVMAYLFLLSVLMVSTLPFFSPKHLRLTDGNPRLNLVLLSIAVAVSWYNARFILLIGMLGYVLSGPYLFIKRRTAPAVPPA